MYRLKDAADNPINGTFYEPELQKVKLPEVYKISEILKTRKVGRKTQYLVSWKGYPASFNSWVDKNQVSDYKKQSITGSRQ